MNGKKGSEAGIVIEKTEQAVIIAVFEGGIQGM